ncbi:armadillo-like helical domain-containing protein 2 [Tiliqua scincoides]|uniref:armadillo-like helical domain-containing protein 2 n=1 Tax=Tiliqua scincoides TaxID=71010 RepID=UPI00346319B7
MESILNKLQDWYDQHFARPEEEPVKLTSPNFHHHKIITYGADLRNTELPLEERAQAALHIGMLTYTGGINAAMVASNYIQDMMDILTMPDTSTTVRISILKGLSCLCYINYVNQDVAKECHLTDIILACLDEDEDTPGAGSDLPIVKFWACYLMSVICCNNIPCIKLFQDSGDQMLQNRLEDLSNMDWSGWPQNYAEVMIGLLGYQKTKAKRESLGNNLEMDTQLPE